MRTFFLLLCCLMLFSCAKAQKKSFSAIALQEKLSHSEGKQTSLDSILKKHQGKTVLIEIWASWCGDCVKNIPKIKQLQQNNPKTDFVFISLDKNEKTWKKALQKHQILGDNYWLNQSMDGVFGKEIDLNWIPRYLIVNKNGEIALYKAVETDFESVNTLLKQLN